jgi:hypothetical protein
MTEQEDGARLAALAGSGQFEQAEHLARELLRQRPGDPEVLGELCISLAGQTEYNQASLIAEQVLADDSAEFRTRHKCLRELLICNAQLGHIDRGRALVERYRAQYQTRHPADHAWPGVFLWMLGQNEEALASHRAALGLFPGESYLRHQLGTARMSLGDSQGMHDFRSYSMRAFWSHYYPAPPHELSRMWEGEPLAGKSILVVGHGGVGDYIQFIRYARLLRELGARDIVAALPTERIRGLLSSAAGIRIGSIAEGATTDYWTTVFGLCCHLFPEHGTEAQERYLSAPASRLAESQLWLIRRRAAGRRCIAISWHSDMSDGSMRSVPLGTVLPLFGLPNVHWVVTQRGVALQQFLRTGLHAQCSVIGESSTFDDSAALMAGLDGVVSIESYSIHMAGSLGVPTWFLAGRALDWRHLNEETRSVWYPSVRLVRQPAMGDWRGAVHDLRQRLQAL